ncbi:type ISP restriction/modification enzyme [Flammeovirga sp. SJP92]|uniref:type ISP restriction/modification enzyme n=1 Tax=Flammeovirga sp. SJP92 TaxID=1775430 RepID=UPI0007880AC8|nr:type ISP restriction/modification enzyme [Flammeovirga sp. SJP92]KXX72432.1 hypothetical protein AVL50_02180 [Flammeovirga sp. SJP92]
MVGEAIQNLQQQLLYAGNYKSLIQENSTGLIKVFKKSFFPTFEVEDLLRFVSEHIVSKHIISILLDSDHLNDLLNDSIYNAFEELVSKTIDEELFQKTFQTVSENINHLFAEQDNKEALFTTLMAREEGEPLPNYFLGMFRSLMKKHLNNSGTNAQYLYPSFTLPPFLDIEAKSNTIVCYDLLAYYWSAIIIPASTRSFGNSLCFVNIKPQGQKHLDFIEDDSNLNKLINLNRDPVQIVFGTIQQMSLGNRTAHKDWVNKVKKTFKNDSHRNPVSYWFLWAKERLGNNGILVIRGDHSLAAAPEYKNWRKTVAKICQRVYIQAQQYSSQVIYCFIFSKEDEKEGVFYAPSYLEDFAHVHEDSDDWITLSSDEYKNFLCLISDKEKSIFNQTLPTLNLKNKSWHTDFNKKQLIQKVNLYYKNQKKKETLDLDEDTVVSDAQLSRIYIKPFLKKWAYVSKRDVENWDTLQHHGFQLENPTFALSMHKDLGLEVTPTNQALLSTYYSRNQYSTILPLNIYKEDHSYNSNISDWALDRFKQYYVSRLPKVELNNSVGSIQELLESEIKLIERQTNRLPVLHKFTKQLSVLTEDKENSLDDVTKLLHQLTQKMYQLFRGSTEKKVMMQEINKSSQKIISTIGELEKGKIENDTKVKALSKENIFYYCFAILNHPLYQNDFEKELKALPPRIPLLNDFWSWAKMGKEIFQAGTTAIEDIHFTFSEITEESEESDIAINTTQKIAGLTDEQKVGTWDKQKVFQLILQEYRERKPLNKDLQKYYRSEIAVINRLDLLKSIQFQAQFFTKVINTLPDQLFENAGPKFRLKRRN